MSVPPRSFASFAPRSQLGQDAYADLLRDTRGLRREHSIMREAWLSRITVPQKEERLFELEVLMKGLACFANPRNHPGQPRRVSIVANDYREPTLLVREALSKVVGLCRLLLGEHERTFVFQRYLETVLPDDGARTRLVRETRVQDTPEESLFQLRHAMTNLLEVVSGISRLPRVPFRTFFAVLGVAHGEVSTSAFFNPLSALEFRPEFDRITNARLLELTRQVSDESARRLVALTVLSLLRMLKYLDLLDAGFGPGPTYLVLAVLRSDARALTTHLQTRAGVQLAEAYEKQLFRRPARELVQRYEALREEGERLVHLKATLGGIAANLKLELRRAFEHELPSPDAGRTEAELKVAIARVTGTLRPALQNAVLVLGKVLGERLDEHGVFDDASARRALSVRLRRDIWMFAQILRAFGAKARALPDTEERWGGASSLQFVREFLAYFRSMGYPLLRAADYPRFDPFLKALSALQESDLTSPDRLGDAVREAETFTVFLSDLFEAISAREELKGLPFDRREAALALKLYLGD
ncbi:MAG: hypothetical protein JNM74_22355 [Myxococcales bacterium]|nr:hypothetical protein [Myxococcales bacterium]